MKPLLFLSLLTLLASCQDAMRTRPAPEKKNSQEQESLTAFTTDYLIAQVTVGYRAENGELEILENGEDGDERCSLNLSNGNTFRYRINGDTFTLFVDGTRINYQRLSAGDSIVGVWKNTRSVGKYDIEERLSFDEDGDLVIRKDCRK